MSRSELVAIIAEAQAAGYHAHRMTPPMLQSIGCNSGGFKAGRGRK